MNTHTKMKQYACPCCGGNIGEAVRLELAMAAVTGGVKRALLLHMAKQPGQPFTREDLTIAVYGAEGGPLMARTYLSNQIKMLNDAIARYNWAIVCTRIPRNTFGKYRLIPTEVGA